MCLNETWYLQEIYRITIILKQRFSCRHTMLQTKRGHIFNFKFYEDENGKEYEQKMRMHDNKKLNGTMTETLSWMVALRRSMAWRVPEAPFWHAAWAGGRTPPPPV